MRIFVNYVSESVEGMFADDIVLGARSPRMFQKMLDVVYKYSKKYRFCWNQDKSNIMIFGRRGRRQQKFYLGEKELKIVKNYKYLGLILDNRFSFKVHLDKMYDKARKRMTAISGLGLEEGVSKVC